MAIFDNKKSKFYFFGFSAVGITCYIKYSLIFAASEFKQDIPFFQDERTVYQNVGTFKKIVDAFVGFRFFKQFFVCESGISHNVFAVLAQTLSEYRQRFRLTERLAAAERNTGYHRRVDYLIVYRFDRRYFSAFKIVSLRVVTSDAVMRASLNEHDEPHARSVHD